VLVHGNYMGYDSEREKHLEIKYLL